MLCLLLVSFCAFVPYNWLCLLLQVVQQELELLRASSGDKELVEHIKGLEEQLASKSQELQKHRATQLYMQEIKVLISSVADPYHLTRIRIQDLKKICSGSGIFIKYR